MLVAGWGKKSKKIADAGLYKCQNCKNTTTFEVVEISNYASAYFIKFAKWKKQFCLVCSICDATYELTEENKDKLLKFSVELPSNSEITDIWNDIDLLCVDYMKDNKDMEKWNEYVTHEMCKKRYKDFSVEYVLLHYNQNLLDSLKETN